jgi:hypothetical protein
MSCGAHERLRHDHMLLMCIRRAACHQLLLLGCPLQPAISLRRYPTHPLPGFLNTHPGGREMLLLSAGRECTALFTSYHWATEKPRAMLRKYEVRARGGGVTFLS